MHTITLHYSLLNSLNNIQRRFHSMATKERPTRETGACVRDCQSYRVKPVLFQKTLFTIHSFSGEQE